MDASKDDVKGEPGDGKCSNDDCDHPQRAVFALLQLTNSRFYFFGQLQTDGHLPPADTTTYNRVTHDDNEKRNDVTEEQMSDEKVNRFHPRLAPHFNTKLKSNTDVPIKQLINKIR